MTNITKNLICVVMRNNIEIWVDDEKLDDLIMLMENQKFIKIDNQVLNVKDIMGVFNAKSMEEYRRRRNGDWLCDKGTWHAKKEDCGCPKVNEKGEVFYKGQGWVKQI